MVLARLNVAVAYFRAGSDDWREALNTPRPQYDPRYQVGADTPPGF